MPYFFSLQIHFVDKNGTSKWAEFAKALGTKTRFACRCRYSTIQKYLKRFPDANLEDVPRKDKGRSVKVNLDNYLETATKLKASREDPSQALVPTNKSFLQNSSSLKMFSTGDKHTQKLYQYFKYSYNWEFIPDKIPRILSGEDTTRVFSVLQLLDFELDLNRFQTQFTRMSVEDQTNLTLALNVETSNEMKDDIRYVKYFGNKFPVNFNTILGWRAMNMLISKKPFVKVEKPQFLNYAGKYHLFMRRFKQIFYWTALLSKVDIRVVKERIMRQTSEKEESTVIVMNEAIDEEEGLIEVTCADDDESEDGESEEEENAVDFLLSHIKNRSTEENFEEDEENVALDMPNYFDFEEETEDTITIEETKPRLIEENPIIERTEKRKIESPSSPSENEFKRPKRVISSKSMPLT